MPLIKAEQIAYAINKIILLNSIDLEIHSGEIVGLIGPNGAGKSTLLKILAKVLKPNKGKLLFNAHTFESISARTFSQQVSYLEQATTLSWSLTVEQVVKLGRLPFKSSPQESEHVERALEQCGIQAWKPRLVNRLSAGEKALVNLARCLATQPKLILADEPAAALDLHHQYFLMEMLNTIKSSCATMIVMHDLNLAARWCDRLILLNEGGVVSCGSAKEVLSPENLKRYFKVEATFTEGSNASAIEVTGIN